MIGVSRHAWHAHSAEETLALVETTAAGLSHAEAARRRQTSGPNRLMPPRPTPALRLLRDQVASVVVLLLVAAAGVSLALGEGLEAAAIGCVLLLNVGLGFAIDLGARRAMEALAALDAAWCLAMRDGTLCRIEVDGLVPGDLVELESGHTVPADARLLSAHDLRVTEATLTGESLPVPKRPGVTLEADTPLADRANMVYKGTVVLGGSGRAVVTGTGRGSELGRIGALLEGIADERTPLERRLDALGRRLVWLTLVIAALVASVGWFQGLALGRVIETGIALAVAAVPEGLPAVVTIALAIGLRRMAARHALVRRLPAVETLGSVTVVCTDKTRTLTSGEMTLVRVWTADREYVLDEPHGDGRDQRLQHALEVAILASRPQPSVRSPKASGDPVESALAQAAAGIGLDRERLVAAQPLAGVVPFSSERRFMASVHRAQSGLVAYVKGAPIHVLALSDHLLTGPGEVRLDLAGKRRLLAVNRAMAAEGLHVLALARGQVGHSGEPAIRRLTFVGFAGLLDPPAPGVRETIDRLRAAGLRTIMLTGDQRATAIAVGRRLGLLTSDQEVLDGREVQRLSHDELRDRLDATRVFSRITPDAKLAIVGALQERGEIVAMLGDGVNDAAALKKADVGVAMGIRGSDVAKQAASIVLRDDRFETVAAAVEEGRVIYDNIRKFVFYLFSCNLAEILVLLVLGLLGLPPLLPLQILWLNLVTDTFPALALALEPADPDVMRRPPRDPQEALLSRRFLLTMTAYALLIAASTIGASLVIDDPTGPRVVTVAFVTLALAEVFHLGNARRADPVIGPRSATANPYALGALLFTTALQCGIMFWPPAMRLLHLAPLTGRDWVIIGVSAAATAVIGQATKLVHGWGGWQAGAQAPGLA